MCFYLSCYQNGKFPIFSIGPSWPFTIGLLFFALMCLGYLSFLLIKVFAKHPTWCYPSFGLIIINLILLAMGILQDPGVPLHTYQTYNKRYIEYKSGRGDDDSTATEDTSNDESIDEESGSLQKRKSFNQRLEEANGEVYYQP